MYTLTKFVPEVGDRLDGKYKGGRVTTTVRFRMDDRLSFTVCKIALGAVSIWSIHYRWSQEWGDKFTTFDALFGEIMGVDDYNLTFDRLYPIFPPRLMQNLDTGEYDKKNPNLDYVSRIKSRRQ